MPKITVPGKDKFPDRLSASSLFIDSVTAGLGVFARLHYADGSREDQEIVSGSKFLTGKMEWISKVEFVNPSVLSADVVYHYSRVVGYDEARVIGDINALTRPDNLSKDGNQFFGGAQMPALVGNYSVVALYNPAGSGVNVQLSNLVAISISGNVICTVGTGVPSGLDFSTANNSTHNKKIDGAASKARIYVNNQVAVPGVMLGGYIPSASLGVTDIKNGSAPIEFGADRVMYFTAESVNVKITSFFQWSEEVI